MRRDTSIGGAAHDFATTCTTLLDALADPSGADYARHLASLVERYWKPAYHYLRALGRLSVEEAKDLTQDFFARLLDKGYVARFKPGLGSFRGYLKTALRHFLSNAARAARARTPCDGAQLFRFDQAEAEWSRLSPGAGGLDPDAAFDRAWARGVLAEAVCRLEAELAGAGKRVTFELFRRYYLEPAGTGERRDVPSKAPSYEDLAREHGLTVDGVCHGLRFARERVRRLLTAAVEGYAGSGCDVERELRFLLSG